MIAEGGSGGAGGNIVIQGLVVEKVFLPLSRSTPMKMLFEVL